MYTSLLFIGVHAHRMLLLTPSGDCRSPVITNGTINGGAQIMNDTSQAVSTRYLPVLCELINLYDIGRVTAMYL
jgi:hypothetical protein